MSMVKCKACGNTYDIDSSKSCPFCGSHSFISTDKKTEIEYGRQDDMYERQKAKARIKEQRDSFTKLVVGGIIGVLIVSLLILALTINSINKSHANKFDNAVALMEQGNYDDALVAFKQLGRYSDSSDYVQKVELLIEERSKIYEKAKSYYANRDYKNAIGEFDKCKNYLDSMDYIEKASLVLLGDARNAYNNGDYDSAQKIIETIPEYSSSKTEADLLAKDIISAIEAAEMEHLYKKAVNLFENKKYDDAQGLFITLKDYLDSASYRDQIGEYYFSLAKDCYNNKSLIECGELLSKINAKEKWDQYSNATELLLQVKNEYTSIVTEEAKSLCREKGVIEMQNYIDDKICVLLSDAEASTLKKDCIIQKVGLEGLEPFSKGSFGLGHEYSQEDTLGNVYPYALHGYMSLSDGGAYEVYNVQKQYKYFIATVAVAKKSNGYSIDESRRGHIRIYGDDNLLWSADDISGTTKPYNIQVDISGVEDIKIEMYGDGNGGYHGIHVLLCSPLLSE